MPHTNKSVLLLTSASTDVQYSGGEILIPGLEPIRQGRVIDFSQINYRAEVVQVVTVNTTATPTGSTKYGVLIGDPNRRDHGYTEFLELYSYTTPSDITVLGATAALQREAINVEIIAKINKLSGNFVTAATLGTGTGFTITDTAGYYPANKQGMTNRKGASVVRAAKNPDGTGFTQSQIVLTTAWVIPVGVGANLQADAPVYDLMTGNLIAGEIEAPKTISGAIAVSGQRYNMFSISDLRQSPIPSVTGVVGFIPRNQQVWVDNGTGTSTANLAGYISFERAMHRGIAMTYVSNPSSQIDFFDNVILFQGPGGAVPATTGETKMVSDAKWVYNNIGTNTITTPTPSNAGLVLDQDLTATEGAEYTPSLLTLSPKEFTVGKQDFSVFARVSATTWANGAWQVGFHTKAAHSATFAYTNLASVGTLAASPTTASTQGILASAALVSTSTAIVLTNAASYTVEVLVTMNGVVTCKLNDVVYPVYSVGTTPLVLPQNTVMVPFFRAVNVGGSAPVLVISENLALPTVRWKY